MHFSRMPPATVNSPTGIRHYPLRSGRGPRLTACSARSLLESPLLRHRRCNMIGVRYSRLATVATLVLTTGIVASARAPVPADAKPLPTELALIPPDAAAVA